MTDGPSMPTSGAQQLERVYEEYTPLLLSAVRSLLTKGYEVHPAEGLELVHDFYLEALPGLLARYDASRGKFSTYVYAAFLRFVRPRLVRDMRWRRLFVPFEDAIAHPAAAADTGPSEALVGAAERALSELPAQLRAVIDGRLRRGESERQMARRLRLSRHVVRQRLAEALGRIAVAIGREEAIREDLRPLALRLWRDGQPMMRVALELRMSRQQVRQRVHELVRSLNVAASTLDPKD